MFATDPQSEADMARFAQTKTDNGDMAPTPAKPRRPRAPRAADIAVTLQWLDDAMARYQDGMQSNEGDAELEQVERVAGYLSRLKTWTEREGLTGPSS